MKNAQDYANREEVFESFSRHVSPGKVATFREFGFDVVMGRREGVFFYDAFNERRFFNCHSNGGVFNLGHRHPAVIAAVREALDHVDIGNHHLVSGYRATLATRLAATTNGRLEGVVFGSARRTVRATHFGKEIRAYYEKDASTWALLQRLRRMDRSWQMKIRRRPYPFLLPGPIAR